MIRRLTPYVLVALLSMTIGSILKPFDHLPAIAQSTCQTFTETGKQVCGRFLEYWQKNGGLAQQGLPLSNEFVEVSDLNGKSYTVQYFERAVFEKHPENAAPYDVLLSQLGTFRFKAKYPAGDPSGKPSIIGQVIEYTGYSGKGKMRATVTDVKEVASLAAAAGNPEQVPDRGKFVLVFVTVTNSGNEAGEMAVGFKIQGGNGSTYARDVNPPHESAAKIYGVVPNYTTLKPGQTDKTVVVFNVPSDFKDYKIVPAE
ncbi:MAG: DUF4352 domain-containing protein [Chloroflexota bacterium]